jgi:hypothetical protein
VEALSSEISKILFLFNSAISFATCDKAPEAKMTLGELVIAMEFIRPPTCSHGELLFDMRYDIQICQSMSMANQTQSDNNWGAHEQLN